MITEDYDSKLMETPRHRQGFGGMGGMLGAMAAMGAFDRMPYSGYPAKVKPATKHDEKWAKKKKANKLAKKMRKLNNK